MIVSKFIYFVEVNSGNA